MLLLLLIYVVLRAGKIDVYLISTLVNKSLYYYYYYYNITDPYADTCIHSFYLAQYQYIKLQLSILD